MSGADRLVLLGDVVELRHGPVRDALDVARPVLEGSARRSALAARSWSSPATTITTCAAAGWSAAPHDGPRRRWAWRRRWTGVPASRSRWSCGPSPRRGERARGYPGVWLRDDVYATHGHYCDLHTTVPMFERLGAGVMRRIVGLTDGGPRTVEDYERSSRRSTRGWIRSPSPAVRPGRSSHGASAQAWQALEAPGLRRRRAALRRRGGLIALSGAGGGAQPGRLGPLHADSRARSSGARRCARSARRSRGSGWTPATSCSVTRTARGRLPTNRGTSGLPRAGPSSEHRMLGA